MERERGRERGWGQQKDILSVESKMMSAANEFPSRLLLLGESKNKTLLYEQRAAPPVALSRSASRSNVSSVCGNVSNSQPTQSRHHRLLLLHTLYVSEHLLAQ